jgi:hypothetical protein
MEWAQTTHPLPSRVDTWMVAVPLEPIPGSRKISPASCPSAFPPRMAGRQSPSLLDGGAPNLGHCTVRPTSRPGIRPTHSPVVEEQEVAARQYWKGKMLLITRHQQRGAIIPLTELMRLLETHNRPPRFLINLSIVWQLLQEDQYRSSTFICVAANRSSNWRPRVPQSVTISIPQSVIHAQDDQYLVEQQGTARPFSWSNFREHAESLSRGRPRPSSSITSHLTSHHRSRSPV